ncbi:MAG: class I SAM-dependent methyltransferase [bacterium]
MKRFNELWKKSRWVEGWLSKSEAKILYKLSKGELPDGDIIEIGSYKGRSTIFLASDLPEDRKVIAIDTHRGSDEHRKAGPVNTLPDFRQTLKRFGIEDNVDVVVSDSIEAGSKYSDKASIIFIDGSHKYEDVKRDTEVWKSHLADNGYILLHDTIFWDGPVRAFIEEIAADSDFTVLGRAHSLMYAVKRDSGFAGRIRARAVLTARRLYEILYRIKRQFLQ